MTKGEPGFGNGMVPTLFLFAEDKGCGGIDVATGICLIRTFALGYRCSYDESKKKRAGSMGTRVHPFRYDQAGQTISRFYERTKFSNETMNGKRDRER